MYHEPENAKTDPEVGQTRRRSCREAKRLLRHSLQRTRVTASAHKRGQTLYKYPRIPCGSFKYKKVISLKKL